jgi:hypothetical protein
MELVIVKHRYIPVCTENFSSGVAMVKTAKDGV